MLIISFSIFSEGFSFSCEFRDIVFQTKMDRCQQCTCWKCFTNKRFLSAKNIDDRVGAVVCQEHLVYSWSWGFFSQLLAVADLITNSIIGKVKTIFDKCNICLCTQKTLNLWKYYVQILTHPNFSKGFQPNVFTQLLWTN